MRRRFEAKRRRIMYELASTFGHSPKITGRATAPLESNGEEENEHLIPCIAADAPEIGPRLFKQPHHNIPFLTSRECTINIWRKQWG